jgi:hypothetical protein
MIEPFTPSEEFIPYNRTLPPQYRIEVVHNRSRRSSLLTTHLLILDTLAARDLLAEHSAAGTEVLGGCLCKEGFWLCPVSRPRQRVPLWVGWKGLELTFQPAYSDKRSALRCKGT